MNPLALQLAVLGATLAIELPLVAALAGSRRRAEVALAASYANLASHSLASAAQWTVAPPWCALELAVVAFEAIVLRATVGLSWRRACALSLLTNAASAGFALAVG